jgi:hypothetical protein
MYRSQVRYMASRRRFTVWLRSKAAAVSAIANAPRRRTSLSPEDNGDMPKSPEALLLSALKASGGGSEHVILRVGFFEASR